MSKCKRGRCQPTIHAVSQAGDVAGLEALSKEEGFDVDARDESNVTPLHWAAINAHVGACQ